MNETYTFDDVQLVPNYNPFPSRNDPKISTEVALEGENHKYLFSIPIVSSNMDTITGSLMATSISYEGGLAILHRFCTIEENIRMFLEATENTYIDCELVHQIGVSVGVNEGLDRVDALLNVGARIICIDVAHGHSHACGQMVKKIKANYLNKFPDLLIIAGNVCTKTGADYLVGCGADVVKVGIGGGSVCTTRIKTGVGIPQLSAIIECARCEKPIIADGGVRTPGDVCKALAAGASMVMLGGMLAGCTETPGEVTFLSETGYNLEDFSTVPNLEKLKEQGESIETNLSKYYPYKIFRGMASKEANEDQFGTMADWKTAEGISTIVPCKGPVSKVIKDIMGGLRSCMTYLGAESLQKLRSRAQFVRISQGARNEALPHFLNNK